VRSQRGRTQKFWLQSLSRGDAVAQILKDRATDAVSSPSRVMVAVIAFSLFIDYFLYGMLFPLGAHFPAGSKGEGQLALLYGVYAISVLLVTPVFGYLGDRIGGRSTMIGGAALAVCAVSLLGLAPNLWLLLLGKFCQGAASAGLWTSGLALIAENYVEKRVVMLGYAFTGGTFGSVIGPVAGGFLYHAGGYRLPFLTTGVAFAIAAALIARLVPAGSVRRNAPVNFLGLVRNRSLMVPAVAVALAAFSVGIIEPLLPVRLARYGASSMTIGILFTVSTLVYGLSAPVVGHVSERIPVQNVIVIGTIAMAATLPFLALFKGVILAGITLCLVNLSFAFMLNPASAELGNAVDRSGMASYAAVYAVYNIFYSVGMLSTAALASAAARLLSFWGVLLCASAVLLLSIPFLLKAGPSRAAATAASGK
jgi:MFS transporter, DHA1 family, solute carrier family 18 (vesicular amine transporter), member 1/2